MSFCGCQSTFWMAERSLTEIALIEHPNLHLSPEERRLFGQLFSAADSDKIGVVTGEVAVKFFEKTRLSPDVLGEVGLLGRKPKREPQLTTQYHRYGRSRTVKIEGCSRLPALELS